MFKLIWNIFKDEQGGTLSITRKTANTLATASGMALNYSEIEAVVNDLDGDNIADDAIDKEHLASGVVRANYGLVQHTDGSLYVDVSDTNPSLEISDGGLRAKVDDSTIQRTSNGLAVIQSGLDHGSIGGLTDDDHTQYLLKTGSIASITTRTHSLLSTLTANDHPQYARGQGNNYKIDSGSVSAPQSTNTTITFNFTFSAAPKLLLTILYAGGTRSLIAHIVSITTTSAVIIQSNDSTVTVHWIAIGQAA